MPFRSALPFRLGCALALASQYNFNFQIVSDPMELSRRIFEDKGAAQGTRQQTERHSRSSHQAAKPF